MPPPQVGSSVTLADFCPYVQEFTWQGGGVLYSCNMKWIEETEIGTQRKIPKIKLKVVWGVARSPEAQDVMTRSTSQIVRFILYISYLPLLLPLEET